MSAELTIGQVGRTRARYGFIGFSNTSGELGNASISWTPAGTAVEFIVYASNVDWTPGGTDLIVDCHTGRARFELSTGGTLLLRLIGAAGTSTYSSSAANTITDGTAAWLRGTINVSTNTAKFYTSTDPVWTDFDSVSWTQLGTDINAATAPTTITACTDMTLGNSTNGANPFNGRIYKYRVTNSGTVVSRFDFGDGTYNGSSYTDDQGNSWSLTTVRITTEGDDDDTFQIAPNPDISWDGDRVSFSGDLIAATLADARAARRQLAGYVGNTDEPVIPVRWSGDDDLTGFYQVVGADVSTIPASYVDGKGWFPFSVDLVAVPDRYSPQFEVLVDGTNRSNTGSMTGIPWVGLPEEHDGRSASPAGSGSATAYTNSGVYLVQLASLTSTGAWFTFSPNVENYNDGACRIETAADGVNWRVVTGRQIPDQDTNWRLTNGWVRVTGRGSGQVRVEVWDANGVQWEPVDFQIGVYSSAFGTIGELQQPAVNVNRPETASIQLGVANSARKVNLTVRRGSPLIYGYTGGSSDAAKLSVSRTASHAATAITNGIISTSADTNGNKFVLLSASTVTQVTTNTSGIYTTSSATAFPFAMSPIQGTTPFSATNNYWMAVEHFQQHVPR